MGVTKPYKFIGFGAMDVPKPYKFIGFGDIHGPKPKSRELSEVDFVAANKGPLIL